MPNENDERYEGTFETFSTAGCSSEDKFDLDETWKGDLLPSSGLLLTREQDIVCRTGNKRIRNFLESRRTDVDTVSDIRSAMSNGVTGYWIPSGYNGW